MERILKENHNGRKHFTSPFLLKLVRKNKLDNLVTQRYTWHKFNLKVNYSVRSDMFC